jgi:hypothetical protein
MAVQYELIDVDSGNMVAIFDSEDEALASVRATLHAQGRSAVATLGLGSVDEDGDGEAIAVGEALIERATTASVSHAD